MMFTNFGDSIRKLEAAEAKNVTNQEQYKLAFRRERLRSLASAYTELGLEPRSPTRYASFRRGTRESGN